MDLVILLVIGLIGLGMRRYGLPVLPAVIGVILGPAAEQQLRRALQISDGSVTGLVNTPFAVTVYAVIVVLLAWPWIKRLVVRLRRIGTGTGAGIGLGFRGRRRPVRRSVTGGRRSGAGHPVQPRGARGLPRARPPRASTGGGALSSSPAVVSGRRHHGGMSIDPPADPTAESPGHQGRPPLPTADAAYWDAAAETFDEEPDHGLRDPAVRAAWAARMRCWLPPGPCDLLDLGCGTGSLALLAAEQGHRVTGVDRSPGMVERARTKLAGRDAAFLVGDAAEPPVGERRFDVVLVRHVLWALPDPRAALRRWAGLLAPGGRLVLIEGRWGESAPIGIPASRTHAPSPSRGRPIRILSRSPTTAPSGAGR